MAKTIRLASEIEPDSIVNGDGIRTVIWTQGCSHNCLGCHNKETHDFKGGFIKKISDLKLELEQLRNQDGITISGGDPFFQAESTLEIVKIAKELGLNIWCYSGFTFEQLLLLSKKRKVILDILKNIDVLVDGKFILEEKSFDVLFRGSKNQRIIDTKKSVKYGKAMEVKKYKAKKQVTYKKEYLFV